MPYNSLTDRDEAAALIPEDASREILGPIAEASAIGSLATRAPDMSRKQRRIPVWSTLPHAYFVNGDTGMKQTTEVAWDNVYLNAEELAVIVPVPDAVVDDADYPIFETAKPQIVTAFGKAFDRAVLLGENAPTAWPDPIVDGASSAGHVVNVGEVGDVYDDILGEGGVVSLVEEDGFFVNGHVAALSMRAKYRGLREKDGDGNATGQPIFIKDPSAATGYLFDGEALTFPRNGALLASDDVLQVSGDWSQLIWAVRQDITYKVLDQAVITDAENNIIYNLAQQDMVALRVVFRVAWALPNPVNHVNSDADTRYPFAVYATATGVTS